MCCLRVNAIANHDIPVKHEPAEKGRPTTPHHTTKPQPEGGSRRRTRRRTRHLDGVARRRELPLPRSPYRARLLAIGQRVECPGDACGELVVRGDGSDGAVGVGVLAWDEAAAAVRKLEGLSPDKGERLLLEAWGHRLSAKACR